VEVLEGAGRLDAVVGVGRDCPLAQQIMLDANGILRNLEFSSADRQSDLFPGAL
jgi:hypothetical protein